MRKVKIQQTDSQGNIKKGLPVREVSPEFWELLQRRGKGLWRLVPENKPEVKRKVTSQNKNTDEGK